MVIFELLTRHSVFSSFFFPPQGWAEQYGAVKKGARDEELYKT